MSVKIKSLTKIYGHQKAVDDVSFEAHKGQIVGFLGPNGAGKSTTMKIATTFIPPTSGSVEVCGINVTDDPLAVRRLIGYLPEHNPLYLDMFVHEYLGFIGSLHGIIGKRLRMQVSDMINLCGLTLEQNKKIAALSKGYRQRVGLAQALLHDPPVLILDEPTTGLDPNQIVEIRSVIKNISLDKTVIFSTHIMQEVQALCERVVIINKGKIVADDQVETLKKTQKAEMVITVEFLEEINSVLFEDIEGVNSIQEIGKGKYSIKSDAAIDIRPAISQIANQNHYTLLGLNQEESSLEGVFHNLTKDKAPS